MDHFTIAFYHRPSVDNLPEEECTSKHPLISVHIKTYEQQILVLNRDIRELPLKCLAHQLMADRAFKNLTSTPPGHVISSEACGEICFYVEQVLEVGDITASTWLQEYISMLAACSKEPRSFVKFRFAGPIKTPFNYLPGVVITAAETKWWEHILPH
jgi:hypothetical protein